NGTLASLQSSIHSIAPETRQQNKRRLRNISMYAASAAAALCHADQDQLLSEVQEKVLNEAGIEVPALKAPAPVPVVDLPILEELRQDRRSGRAQAPRRSRPSRGMDMDMADGSSSESDEDREREREA
ncbi:hypothetical protein KIPB_012703, partial [Kipferlia bialata]